MVKYFFDISYFFKQRLKDLDNETEKEKEKDSEEDSKIKSIK